MTLEPAQIAAAGWPLAVSLAAIASFSGLRAGRRRNALNEALHELRRPLQALVLTAPPVRPSNAGPESSLWIAAAALERLDREINGTPAAPLRAPIAAQPLVAAAVERGRARAHSMGRSLRAEWRTGDAAVHGDRCELSQALDNLIVNAIEHGGPTIVVAAKACRGRLLVSVVDSGDGARAGSRRPPRSLRTRLRGSCRHGHGLRVVRRTAANHGGRFALERSGAGTEAVLELPLLDSSLGHA